MAELRLRTARLTNATLVAQVDDYLGAFETQLAAMLGLTADVDVTESHFLLDNSGRITKALLRVKAVKPCANIFNSTVPKNILLGWLLKADVETFQRFGFGLPASVTDDEHLTDSGTSEDASVGFWLRADRPADASGKWEIHGTRVNGSHAGLIPSAPGNIAYALDGNGNWNIPGLPAATCELGSPQNSTGNQSGFAYGSSFDVYWASETDPYGLHAASAKGIVIATAGKYQVSMSLGIEPAGALIGDYTATLKLIRDRSSTLTTWAFNTEESAATARMVFNVEAIVTCSASDILYGNVQVDGSGGTWGFSPTLFGQCNMHVAKVG